MNRTIKSFSPRSEKIKFINKIFKSKRLFKVYKRGYSDCLTNISSCFFSKLNSEEQMFLESYFDKVLRSVRQEVLNMERHEERIGE